MPLRVGTDEVKQSALDWMAKGFFKPADLDRRAELGQPEAFVLPVWAFQAQARVRWTGRVLTTRNQNHRDYNPIIEREFDREFYWPVLSRLLEGEVFGTDALKPGGMSVRPDWGDFVIGGSLGLGQLESEGVDLLTEGKAVSADKVEKRAFDIKRVGDMRVLHGQVEKGLAQDVARREMQDALEQQVQEEAKREGAKIQHREMDLKMGPVDLVYLPVWQLSYRYGKKDYRMLFEPRRGEVLAGEHPVGLWDKVVILCGLYGAGAAVVALLGSWSEIGELGYAALAICAIGLIHAVATAMGHGKQE